MFKLDIETFPRIPSSNWKYIGDMNGMLQNPELLIVPLTIEDLNIKTDRWAKTWGQVPLTCLLYLVLVVVSSYLDCTLY